MCPIMVIVENMYELIYLSIIRFIVILNYTLQILNGFPVLKPPILHINEISGCKPYLNEGHYYVDKLLSQDCMESLCFISCSIQKYIHLAISATLIIDKSENICIVFLLLLNLVSFCLLKPNNILINYYRFQIQLN